MDTTWDTFAKALATVGPVGTVLLIAWYLWLRYPRPLGGVATRNDQVASRQESREDRDVVRDTQSSTMRIEAMQRELATAMKDIASTLQTMAGMLEQLTRVAGRRR